MDESHRSTLFTMLLEAARDAGNGAQHDDAPNALPEPEIPRVIEQRGDSGSRSFVGTVLGERHPLVHGRVMVRYDRDETPRDVWLPVMRGVGARPGDTVLLVEPHNWCEPFVVGVVDGFSELPTRAPVVAHQLALRDDEVVEVRDSWGRPLLHLREGAEGPVLSLARADVDLEIAGRLRIRAESLELAAVRGGVQIDATDDVVIRGEIIHLN